MIPELRQVVREFGSASPWRNFNARSLKAKDSGFGVQGLVRSVGYTDDFRVRARRASVFRGFN